MKEIVKYRVINDDILTLFSENISKHDLSDLLIRLDLDASVVEFDSLILREYNNACPVRRITITKITMENLESQAT